MGTNFYVDADATCDNPAHRESLHIGKSSAGWKFGFHGIPELGLTSWAAWQEFLVGRQITDEYGTELTLAEFVSRVENRRVPSALSRPICRVEPTPEEIRIGFGGQFSRHSYHDADGFDFTDGEFS